MAENEAAMGGSDVPTTDGIYTAEDADRALRKFQADVMANPRHAYWGNHPQQQDWLDYVRALHKIKFPEEGPPMSKASEAMASALEDREQEQFDRVQQGNDLMDDLVAEGFERAEVPDDLTEGELIGLETQLIAARGDWDEVDRRIKIAFEQLPLLATETRRLYRYGYKNAQTEEERLDYRPTTLRLCRAS